VDWGPVVALAIEPSKALVYVSDQLDLVPRAYDRGGNRVPAPAVSWSVDDADIATVDPSGRLRALRDGDVRVTATAGTHMATANIQVRTPAGVFISEIAPARLTPGVVAAIRGSGFNAQIDANEVTIDGEPATIVAATTTELMVRLPAAGAEACLPTRDAKIHVRVSYPDTVLAGDLLHPYSTTPQLNLVAGEAARFLAPDFAGCVELPVTGGRYILSLFNTSTASSSLASVSLEGVTADSTAAPAVISVAASRISVSAPRDSELEQGARLHHAILESNQEIARLGGAGRMVGPDLAAAIAEPPAPGEIVDLRVPSLNNLCSQYTPVAGRVVYSGTRAVILEDPANPNAGHMDHVYHAIGQEFDQDMWPVLLANFGDPLAYNHQLHGDGRIYMLFTRRVQEMGGSGLAGFVTTADFSSRANCPSSDQREISYLAAPDSVSDVDEWHRRIRSTVIHEGKHITSYAERYSQGAGGVTEVLWLEESTAMIAEELWVREIFGYRQHGATQYIDGMWCEVRGCTKDDPWVMVDHFAFLSRYMEQVEILSPIWGSDPNSTYYGSGWALVRWVVDRYASSEAAFLRELTQQHTATDIDNLLDRAGTTFPEILADWTLALAAGRYRGFTPHDAAQTFPSWDLRDVYAGLKADFNAVGGWFDSPYPLSVREAGYGNFRIDVPQIRAGSAAFIEISGDQTSPQVLRLGGSDGVPATILMSIMRID